MRFENDDAAFMAEVQRIVDGQTRSRVQALMQVARKRASGQDVARANNQRRSSNKPRSGGYRELRRDPGAVPRPR